MNNELYYDQASYAAAMAFISAYLVVILVIAVITLVGMWKMFAKAGKPGWAAIVPIYNIYCLFDISFGNGWLFLLMLIPIVNIVVGIMMYFKLAKAFGQGVTFGFGLLFLNTIFVLILGFGKAQYVGPNNNN